MYAPLALALLVAAAPSPSSPSKGRPYDAQHYALTVTLHDDGSFASTVVATVKVTRATAELEFDAYDLTIGTVQVDGETAEAHPKYDPAKRTGVLTIKPKKPLTVGKDAVVSIAFTGKAGTANYGFFRASEPGAALPGYFTEFEPQGAQRFFPCNDTPADKATTEVLAVVDARYQVVSNGTKVKDEAFSEDGKNLRRVQWKQDKPHSVYLVALAIAPYEQVLVSDELPSTLWVPPGTKDRAYVAQDSLKGLANFQRGFVGVRYPWAKLDVAAVPNLFYSGMENTSVIFERTSRLLVDHKNDQLSRTRIVSLLAHEMAHQYFGNLVTCATWDDTWLNEGFATYLGSLTTDDYNGADNDEVELEDAVELVETYFRQEAGPRAHALASRGSSVEDSFDAVTYLKGAHVLKMLDVWLGRAEFKKAVKAYLEKYAGQAVTSDEFFKSVAETTKKDKEIKAFKDSWLNKKGYPIIFTDFSYGNGKLSVTIRQQPSATGEKGPFVFKLPIVVHRQTEPAYSVDAVVLVDQNEVKATIDVPAAPQWVNWNKDFGALVKVNAPTVSEDQWIDAVRYDPDPVWRFIAASNLLGGLALMKPKDETRPSDAAMGALDDLLQKDPSPYVREAVLLKLADTHFKHLPKEMGPVFLSLARRPLALADDSVGYVRVRRAAIEALGRTEFPDGQRYLLDEVAKRELDINYVGAYAAGVARMNTSAALTTLRAAIVTQKERGAIYYRRAVEPLGSVTSEDVVSVLREVILEAPGDAEVLAPIIVRLQTNLELKETQEYADLIRDLVLDEAHIGEDLRADLLQTLEDVTYESARLALTEIAEKSVRERTKNAAKLLLATNFPHVQPAATPAPPAAPAPKKKK